MSYYELDDPTCPWPSGGEQAQRELAKLARSGPARSRR